MRQQRVDFFLNTAPSMHGTRIGTKHRRHRLRDNPIRRDVPQVMPLESSTRLKCHFREHQRLMLVRYSNHSAHPTQEPELHLYRHLRLLHRGPHRPGTKLVFVPSPGHLRSSRCRGRIHAGHHDAIVPCFRDIDQPSCVRESVPAVCELESFSWRRMVVVRRGAVRPSRFLLGDQYEQPE